MSETKEKLMKLMDIKSFEIKWDNKYKTAIIGINCSICKWGK
jgi:hypothetical protein